MWLHMLLSYGFNGTYSCPFTQLRHHVGIDKWETQRSAIDSEETKTLVAQKNSDFEQHKAELAKTEADKARVDRGDDKS